ncbi:MAG: hypothetical protein PHC61_16135 [Chitinivibrionales bacterium]|nr:hypothetical protein [Chitinivibrionales bacterium]
MFEIVKKGLFMGIGAAFMTKEKLMEIGQSIAREAKLSEQEGKKFMEDLLKKSENARAAGEKMIRETVEKTFKSLDLPMREEIKALERRIAAPENK